MRLTGILPLVILLLLLPEEGLAKEGRLTVGVIIGQGADLHERTHKALMDELSARRLTDRIDVIVQRPFPDAVSWGNAVRKLMALGADLIVSYGGPATRATLKERPGVPVMYMALPRPMLKETKGSGGVCTEITVTGPLRYLKAAGASGNVGVLFTASEEDSRMQADALRDLAARYGIRLTEINIVKPGDATSLIYGHELSALIVTSSNLIWGVMPSVFTAGRNLDIPIVTMGVHDRTAPLIAIYPDPHEMGRKGAAMLAAFITEGKPPEAAHPCFDTSQIVFNMRRAGELGIIMPMNLVMEATFIIK